MYYLDWSNTNHHPLHMSDAEEGTTVPTSGTKSDVETGSLTLNKRGASSPERDMVW